MDKRVVKFRAWDKHGQFNPDGNPQMLEDVGVTTRINQWLKVPSWVVVEGQIHIHPEASGFVLMQFTGLVDQDGREVYEGDVLENERRMTWFEVVWDGDRARFGKRPLGDEAMRYVSELQDMGHWRVVGNIHEIEANIERTMETDDESTG